MRESCSGSRYRQENLVLLLVPTTLTPTALTPREHKGGLREEGSATRAAPGVMHSHACCPARASADENKMAPTFAFGEDNFPL